VTTSDVLIILFDLCLLNLNVESLALKFTPQFVAPQKIKKVKIITFIFFNLFFLILIKILIKKPRENLALNGVMGTMTL
jgi:hypothetical protein